MEIIQRPSPNFYDLWYPADIIVLHTTLGSFEGALSYLSKIGNPSAHFTIGRLGQIVQLVSLDKGAWHAGRIKNPSERAKAVLKKNLWSGFKNPNRHSWGFEFAAGYDIDKDGILEGWEKLYTPQQIKSGVLLHMWCEAQKDCTINGAHTLIHKDITSYKPDLEIHRLMYLSELQKQRELKKGQSNVIEERKDEVESFPNLSLELGQTYRPELKAGKVVFIKV